MKVCFAPSHSQTGQIAFASLLDAGCMLSRGGLPIVLISLGKGPPKKPLNAP